ncbi:MAG TPA: hypothetical protein VNO21_08980, partial [Polyangiaceae bacterium]|nr:hypothetical protein [Polyangiaceae bacterium]
MLRALAHNPDDRYRSAKELYRELHAVAIAKGALASRMELATYMQDLFPDLPDLPSNGPQKPDAGDIRPTQRIGWQGTEAAPRGTMSERGPGEPREQAAQESTKMAADDDGRSHVNRVNHTGHVDEDADTFDGPMPPMTAAPPPAPPRSSSVPQGPSAA